MKTQDVKLYAAQQLHRLQALPTTSGGQNWQSCVGASATHPASCRNCGEVFAGNAGKLSGPQCSLGGRVGGLPCPDPVCYASAGNDRPMNCPGNTLGRAVRQLAERNSAGQDWTEASVLRRFNALVTAEEITEISHHLRGMIQLLSAAKDGGIPLDYPQLAADLYELQCTDPRYAQTPANVRLRWGQDLYRDPKPAPDEKEKEN